MRNKIVISLDYNSNSRTFWAMKGSFDPIQCIHCDCLSLSSTLYSLTAFTPLKFIFALLQKPSNVCVPASVAFFAFAWRLTCESPVHRFLVTRATVSASMVNCVSPDFQPINFCSIGHGAIHMENCLVLDMLFRNSYSFF